MTEVEYGGGGHRTRLGKINRSTCVSRGAPLPPYIKEQGGEAAGQGGRAKGGDLLPPGVGLLLFLVGVGEGRKGERRRRKKGGAAPLLVQFGLEWEGAHGCPGRPSSSPTRAH